MLGLILIMEDAAMIDLLVICVVIWLRRTKLEVRAFRYFLREGGGLLGLQLLCHKQCSTNIVKLYNL